MSFSQIKKWGFHSLLFVATFLTATLIQGPVFAITIMTCLLAHELGHYWMCRRYGVKATFPIFIPMPNILGTLGAIIAMKSPIPNRKALFDIGVAGPLAGLAFAIPCLILGLHLSSVEEIPKDLPLMMYLGEPLLFQFLSRLIWGTIPQGYDLFIHPIGFAGWAVLFVTAINLFPAGQLDGGHIIYAMFGAHGKYFTYAVMGFLIFLGFAFHPMWFVFSAMIFFFFRKHPPPLDALTPLDRKRMWIGYFSFLILILCFTPKPFELMTKTKEPSKKERMKKETLPMSSELKSI